jgi:hypothetical protein
MTTRTIIEYPRFDLCVTVVRPEAVIEGDAEVVSPVQQFVREFWALGAKVRAPNRRPAGVDYGLASTLLRKYDRAVLLDYADTFWHTFAEPYFRDPTVSPMRLFTSRIPDIERGGV